LTVKLENRHITEPDINGFQVRIVRNKKEYSRYFSHRQWGCKSKALNGARSWRDQMLASLGSVNKYISERVVNSRKRSTGVRGVSKSVQYDKRRDVHYLVYSVHWRVSNRVRTKTFYVGQLSNVNADEEFHAFRTAVQFRREYEISKASNESFYPESFLNWKSERCYEA